MGRKAFLEAAVELLCYQRIQLDLASDSLQMTIQQHIYGPVHYLRKWLLLLRFLILKHQELSEFVATAGVFRARLISSWL